VRVRSSVMWEIAVALARLECMATATPTTTANLRLIAIRLRFILLAESPKPSRAFHTIVKYPSRLPRWVMGAIVNLRWP